MNRKNLEHEETCKELKNAREKLENAEKDITALTSKVAMLENSLEDHRQKVPLFHAFLFLAFRRYINRYCGSGRRQVSSS